MNTTAITARRLPSPRKLLIVAALAFSAAAFGPGPERLTLPTASAASQSPEPTSAGCESLCSEREDLDVSGTSGKIPRVKGELPYTTAKTWLLAKAQADAQDYCADGLCSKGECTGMSSDETIESLEVDSDSIKIEYSFVASCDCAS